MTNTAVLLRSPPSLSRVYTSSRRCDESVDVHLGTSLTVICVHITRTCGAHILARYDDRGLSLGSYDLQFNPYVGKC